MKIRYSAATGNFYPYDIDYPVLPNDLIDVQEPDHARVMSRAFGETFSFDADGVLTINSAQVIPFAEIASGYLTEVRITREDILNRISGIGFAAIASGDTATVQAVVTARQALLDITKVPALLAATDAESLKSAVIAAYRAIVTAAPASVRSAFNAVSL